MMSIRTGSDILTGTIIIPASIMTKRIIEPDIPRHIKTKRSCLTSLGTVRDIKSKMKMLQEWERNRETYSTFKFVKTMETSIG